MAYIDVHQLSFSYDAERVLDNISFQLEAGEFAILTGENGAAKSTLLKLILGLLKPQEGSAHISPVNQFGQKMLIGYAPQQIASFNVGFPSRVYDLVASGRYANGKWFKRLDAHDKEHIEKSLKSVGMWDLKYKRIGDLSGGQKQRIFLARLFATDPDLLILDEPTTGMDIQSRKQFYDLLKHSCQHHHKAVLMVTHEDDILDDYIDKHVHLVRKEHSPWRCFSMISCKERS
ncbi:ATP-binding cassette domain-containing protein [Granulicatella sp. zg-ZJ]|uniref:metal ABC transporter ATP-binding protein n=1 Tax=unclassified Granulicatella TaxID=2630493 RepID=UPI0013C078E7|nr:MULTISPECIES: metal ABC transporter ATP-binding protein [unclassified Granulicatella]MBS4750291.1 metal ABC transporter ATP-binding protein [Carnobacteriaceae bacterium zg-ZUI78]NEW63377.1 ATP-binding cassette domain-containing protein [Granulicatella sp. zg-ZJ]NEW66570.1 ATP-binding cassette domain-containing protein [Granulicatella sp. zg-84]QMI85772.1 metal ABC transporter ATP-binding protein [Carnobacteriaceae bacterium zg-84]